METTEQHRADLHNRVGKALEKMGQPHQTIPAHERPVFNAADFADIVGHAVKSSIEETLSGKELDTDVRTTPGKRLGRWILDRARRMKGVFQKK